MYEDATESWWWLSFVDPGANRFLGGALIRADDMQEAINEAWIRGINPGGEVRGVEVERLPRERWRNRLLQKEEIREMEIDMVGRSSV